MFSNAVVTKTKDIFINSILPLFYPLSKKSAIFKKSSSAVE